MMSNRVCCHLLNKSFGLWTVSGKQSSNLGLEAWIHRAGSNVGLYLRLGVKVFKEFLGTREAA